MRRYCALLVALFGLMVSLQGQGRQVVPGSMSLPFSAAVKADGLIYVAGTLSQDSGDIKVQSKKVLDDLVKSYKLKQDELETWKVRVERGERGSASPGRALWQGDWA